ncbi:MAG: MgtC/SapB family protein [Pirellulales bacterium]|nr:MgtC/SapB family protein [Pirellulales bacterium]
MLMEPAFQQLAVSALLGLLVGLQREHAAGGIAGMRTFPLITLLGTLSAMLADHFAAGGWIVAAGLVGVMGVTAVGHVLRRGNNQGEVPGTTTDAAMLLMFAVGALAVVGPISAAVAVGGGVAVLLQFKPELHGVAKKLGDDDLRAIMQFVLITCIILPVLPNRTFGPGNFFRLDAATTVALAVLNPREIWWMVVLIVGLSLVGYISYKFFGRNAGILLGGILGGAVSSTATTVSYAQNAREDRSTVGVASIVVMIASTVMYIRLLAAVAVVSLDFLRTVFLPAMVLMLLTLLPALALWFRERNKPAAMPKQKNPTQLKSAVVFGLMYAVVLFALAAAKHYWSGEGLYVVSFVSGLTEMDAVTLSTARLSAIDPTVAENGWRMIVLAAMANLISKACIAGILGGRRLAGRVALLFAIPMLGGAALLLLM